MAELTKSLVEAWLDTIEEGQEFHYTKILDGLVEPGLYESLRKIVHQLKIENKIKSVGGRGHYKKVLEIKPVKWWDADESEYFYLTFPSALGGEFAFQEWLNFSPGDLMVIGGDSNAGKSALALNFLADNCDKHKCVLLGNEFTNVDGALSPKFKRRMIKIRPIEDWMNGEGSPKFDLLVPPDGTDIEDYVQKNKLNIIDWIEITDQFWLVARTLKTIKGKVGNGIAICFLQKAEGAQNPVSGQWAFHRADVGIVLDFHGEWESRLTFKKVKDSDKRLKNRSWAFEIINSGAELSNIREVVKCRNCYGYGYKKGSGRCENCSGVGYHDK